MYAKLIHPKYARLQAYAAAAVGLWFVSFLLVAIVGSMTTSWAPWFVIVPLALLLCFVVASVFVGRRDIRLVDAITLDPLIALTRDGVEDLANGIAIPWGNIVDVRLDRKMQRKYEIRADLYLELAEPIDGKTVYSFDVARLAVQSRRVFEMVRHRVRVHAESANRHDTPPPGISEVQESAATV